jgi:hypothetical protein
MDGLNTHCPASLYEVREPTGETVEAAFEDRTEATP